MTSISLLPWKMTTSKSHMSLLTGPNCRSSRTVKSGITIDCSRFTLFEESSYASRAGMFKNAYVAAINGKKPETINEIYEALDTNDEVNLMLRAWSSRNRYLYDFYQVVYTPNEVKLRNAIIQILFKPNALKYMSHLSEPRIISISQTIERKAQEECVQP